VARTINLPYQPAWNDSNEILANGRIKLYEVGGAVTPKVAYLDAAETTSAGSTIDLDSSGRPENGPLYFKGLYFVLIEKNTDGTYSTQDTIDHFGSEEGTTVVSTGSNAPLNGSFEADSDSDGVPDYWNETDSGTVISLESSGAHHGSTYLKFTGTSGSADSLITDYYPITEDKRLAVSFALKASNAAAEPKVQILWADEAQAAVSTTTIYNGDDAATPTDWTAFTNLTSDAPATAAFYRINLIGNASGSAYDVCFDNITATELYDVLFPAPYKPVGLIISNNATDAEHDLDISAGAVKNHDYTHDLILATGITKAFDAPWAYGTNNGGDDGTGLQVSTQYYIYLIHETSTNRTDVIGSASAASPTLPTGWDKYRRIGYWMTEASSNMDSGFQLGNKFQFDTSVTDINDSSVANGVYETGTLSVPPNSTAIVSSSLNVTAGTGNNQGIKLRHADFTADSDSLVINPDTANMDEISAVFEVPVNASSQIDYSVRTDATTTSLNVKSKGAIDHGRDNP